MGKARRGNFLAHTAKIGETGGKAQHIDEIFRGGVNPDDLLRRFVIVLGNKAKVGAHFLPAVEHGDLQHIAWRNPDVVKLIEQALEFLDKRTVGDDLRVVVNHQRAVGRHEFHDPREFALGERDAKRANLRVDVLTDLVAEFHGYGGVAAEQESDVGHIVLLSGGAGLWDRPARGMVQVRYAKSLVRLGSAVTAR